MATKGLCSYHRPTDNSRRRVDNGISSATLAAPKPSRPVRSPVNRAAAVCPQSLIRGTLFRRLSSAGGPTAARTAGGDLPWRTSIRLRQSRSSSRPKPRAFKESVEVAVNLRDVDLSVPKNRVEEDVVLPKGRGKPIRVCVFASGE